VGQDQALSLRLRILEARRRRSKLRPDAAD
jgi:hypothetical protein